MTKLIIFAVLIVTVYGRNLDSKLFGGNSTTIENRPYQAALVSSETNNLRCGASIITTKHLLSAGHCYMSYLSARVGSNSYNSGGQLILVEKFIRHPSYDQSNLNMDFAVVVLAQEIILGPKVQIIPLAEEDPTPDPDVGSMVTVSGWGVTSDGTDSESDVENSLTLIEVDLPMIDREICKKKYSFLNWNQFCLGGTNVAGMSRICFGDSGGPCVQNGVQYGLISSDFRRFCETPQVPGLYARIASARHWIDEMIDLTS